MPVGIVKNLVYGAALPILGKKCEWKPDAEGLEGEVQRLLYRYRTVGASIQCLEEGRLGKSFQVGMAGGGRRVTAQTVFRTASLAKTITALLVFRLQTLGLLSAGQDISELWHHQIRNPLYPEVPITLGMLMSHTSSIYDTPAYFASFEQTTEASDLLKDCFLPSKPGSVFRYSNFAAGMIGCLLESRFRCSLEELAQKHLFQPLHIEASYDLSKQDSRLLADQFRVMPPAKAFDAAVRIAKAKPLNAPDCEHHYLFASGNVFLTAQALAKLTLAAWNGADGLIAPAGLKAMQTPLADWPEKQIRIRHGMGLFRIEDPAVYPSYLWGHQGIAYGAVNGLFFDGGGNGFAILTSGAGEQRKAHLTRLNLGLIHLLLEGNHG